MATARSVRGLGVYLIVVGIVLATFTINGVTSQGCDDAVSGLKEKCSDYVMKLKPKAAPSKACCDVIKSANLDCVCKQMTPGVQLLLDARQGCRCC